MDAFLTVLAEHGMTALGWLLTAVGLVFSRWIIPAAPRWIARWLIGPMGTLFEDVVLSVAQTYTDALRAGRADGKLTGSERMAARKKALEELKSYIGQRGLKLIALAFGLGGVLSPDTEAAERLVESKLESTVKKLKASGAIASTKPAAPVVGPT